MAQPSVVCSDDAATVLHASMVLLGFKQIDASTFHRSNPNALEQALHFLYAHLNGKESHKRVRRATKGIEILISCLPGVSRLLAHHQPGTAARVSQGVHTSWVAGSATAQTSRWLPHGLRIWQPQGCCLDLPPTPAPH